MTERIKERLALLKSGTYKSVRRKLEEKTVNLPEGTDECRVDAVLFHHMLAAETPRLFGDDRFGLNRTIKETPTARVGGREYIDGPGNVTPNYAYVLKTGLDAILARVEKKLLSPRDSEARLLYEAMRDTLKDALAFANRYRAYAQKEGATASFPSPETKGRPIFCAETIL